MLNRSISATACHLLTQDVAPERSFAKNMNK